MNTKEKKYLLNPLAMPSIGRMLDNYIGKHKIYQAALARDMNRHINTIMDYKKKDSLQAAILWELCHALKHNFFAELAASLPADYSGPADAETIDRDKEIARLKEELHMLQREKELLMELAKGKKER